MVVSFDRVLALGAVVCAAGALAFGLLRSVPASPTVDVMSTDATAEEIVRLRARVAALSAEVVALRESRPAVVVAASPAAESRISSVNAPTVEVVRSVEDMRWVMTQRGLMPPTEAHLERARGMIFAAGSTINEKLLALRILRSGEALSDDVVGRMIDVYHSVDDTRAQTEIIRRLDDVRTPALADLLLTASASSESSRLRQAAVDSLSGFLPDPDLKIWLETVSANDPNKRVQAEAARLLAKFWAPTATP